MWFEVPVEKAAEENQEETNEQEQKPKQMKGEINLTFSSSASNLQEGNDLSVDKTDALDSKV